MAGWCRLIFFVDTMSPRGHAFYNSSKDFCKHNIIPNFFLMFRFHIQHHNDMDPYGEAIYMLL